MLRSKILFSGASSGIGEATALEFAREGAKVALNSRTAEKLKKTAAKCQKAGVEGVEEENVRTHIFVPKTLLLVWLGPKRKYAQCRKKLHEKESARKKQLWIKQGPLHKHQEKSMRTRPYKFVWNICVWCWICVLCGGVLSPPQTKQILTWDFQHSTWPHKDRLLFCLF